MKIDFLHTDADSFAKILPAIRFKKDVEKRYFTFYRQGDARDICILTYNVKKKTCSILANTDFTHKNRQYYKKSVLDTILKWVGKTAIDGMYSFVFDAKQEKIIYDLTMNKEIYFFSSFPPPRVENNEFYLVRFVDQQGEINLGRLKQDRDNLFSLANFYTRSRLLFSPDKIESDGVSYAYAIISASLGIPFKVDTYTNTLKSYLSVGRKNREKILLPKLVHKDFSLKLFTEEADQLEETGKGKKVDDSQDSFDLSEILELGVSAFEGVKSASVTIDLDLWNHLEMQIYYAFIDDGVLILYAENLTGKIIMEELAKVRDFFESDSVVLADNLAFSYLNNDLEDGTFPFERDIYHGV